MKLIQEHNKSYQVCAHIRCYIMDMPETCDAPTKCIRQKQTSDAWQVTFGPRQSCDLAPDIQCTVEQCHVTLTLRSMTLVRVTSRLPYRAKVRHRETL